MKAPDPTQDVHNSDDPPLNARKVLLGIGATAAALTAVFAPFLAPFRLPYIPATPDQLAAATRLARQALAGRAPARRTIIDIGSGDGRVVLHALRALPHVCEGHGVEMNPWLVAAARVNAWRQGQRRQAVFWRGDLWSVNYRKYDIVLVFAVPGIMEELERKLSREMRPGCAVIATRFPLPNLHPEGRDGLCWLYFPAGNA